jgi:hypothetical protein
MALLGATQAFAASTSDAALQAAEGLWAYTLLQAGGTGEKMPLTGVILFKDGIFAQQSIYDGEPFEKQGAMAHAGPYGAGPKGIHMTGQQTISVAPGKQPPLQFRRDTQHDISAERSGDELTIVFASGTVQKFKRIGPAAGQVHALENGVLALVDGHFVLVDGNEQGVVTGYGKYKNTGTAYEFDVIRWSEATAAKAINRRDVKMKATFDGKLLTLADGRTFRVVAKKS